MLSKVYIKYLLKLDIEKEKKELKSLKNDIIILGLNMLTELKNPGKFYLNLCKLR